MIPYHASFFFLITDLDFLIPAVITQILNPIAELVNPIGIQTKEAKAEMETHEVTVQINIKKVLNIIQNSIYFFMLLTH